MTKKVNLIFSEVKNKPVFEVVEKGLERVACVFRVLGDPSSLTMLCSAAKGFRSGLQFARKLGLTPRKYYRCLRKLCELEVLECRVSLNANGKDHFYVLTPKGRRIHEMVFNDFQSLLNDESIEFESVGYSRVGVINSYEDLVKVAVKLVGEAKSQVLLATRYLDLQVSQSLMYAVARNVELRSVTNEALNLPHFMKLLGSFARNIRPNILKILGIAGKMDNYRVGNVPTSYLIVDGETVVWELPTESFEMAFISRDRRVLETFKNNFWTLWKTASPLPLPLHGGGGLSNPRG